MVKWYYEKKELRTTPSVLNGLPLEAEQRYRREGARFIIDLGSSMNLSLTTMATGVVYFHRFYMFHTFQDFPRYPTACACLFLAGKVEETPKKCKDVVKCAKDLLPDNKFLQFGPEAKSGQSWTEEVMTLERILLQTIKFDLQVEHPYTFLLKYAKCLKGDKNRLQKMVQMAWTFVNDSLCTTLCLQWEPEIIAIALMYLAGKLSKFEVMDWDRRKSEHLRWWDMFVEDMSIEILEDICHQVLDLYSQTQQPPPPDSPPLLQHGQNFPIITNPHSTNVSPVNPTTPQSGSKTSTPIQALTPTMPITGSGVSSSLSSTSYHSSSTAYAYPPPAQIPGSIPPYTQQPPPVAQPPYVKGNPPPAGVPPGLPPQGYVGGNSGYYPPPPGRGYQGLPPK